MTVWMAAALMAALSSSFRDGIQKKLTDNYSPVELGFYGGVLGTLFLLPAAVYFAPQKLTLEIAAMGTFSGLTTVAGIWMYLKALQLGDISKAAPLKKTTPIFVGLLEPLILSTVYSPNVLIGVSLGVGGAIILTLKPGNTLKHLDDLKDPVILLSLGVALIYTASSISQKYVIGQVHPLFLGFFTYLVATLGFTALMKSRAETVEARILKKPVIVGVSALATLSIAFTFFGYSLASAAQVITVKQASIVFSVLIGAKYFDEERMARKLIGSALIIAGVIAVSI